MNETKKAEFEKRQSHRGIKSFFSSTFNPSSHRIHTSAPSPNPNLAIFELLIKIYTLNQISYFPSPSTKREERGYSPCGKGASGEKVGVCCWQGKARKGKERKETDRHVPREAKEMCKWADLWGMTNKQKVRNSGEQGGGGVIRECGSENQDYFTSSILRMGTYLNTS